MVLRLVPLAITLVLVMASLGQAASVTVAPSNAPPGVRAKADLVCDGRDDQVELLASITRAPLVTADIGTLEDRIHRVKCYGKHSVEWLPGDYFLSSTLSIPAAADVRIEGEGAYFHYLPESGDAVVIEGVLRCRYRLGTIESGSSGAALKITPRGAPTLMSIIGFTGLVGRGRKGIGLYIDGGVCTNRFEGTDIYDFDKGVYVAHAAGKIDTNWFWVSYIRSCNTCIREGGPGVDDNVWFVNVDASIPNSVAARTAGTYGSWYIIMGCGGGKGTKALILDPGATHNVIEVHPPLEMWSEWVSPDVWEDNSGNDTNVILTSASPPYRPAQ